MAPGEVNRLPADGKSIGVSYLPAADAFRHAGFLFDRTPVQGPRCEMLFATELMGAKTYDAQGNYVGKIREFFIEPADQPNRVARYLLSLS